MDLEKAYDMVAREALWRVLQVYGIGGRLMRVIKSFQKNKKKKKVMRVKRWRL